MGIYWAESRHTYDEDDWQTNTITVRLLLPTVPGAPTGLVVTEGHHAVELDWTAPADNGGSPITGYQAAIRGPGASPDTAVANIGLFDVTAGPFVPVPTLPGLGPFADGERDLYVRAVNGNGKGPWSTAVTGTTGPATVTIAGDSGVNEGFNAEFILTASKPVLLSSRPLNVSVSVSESEDMVASAEEGAKTVSFAMGDTTATLSVPTVDDGVVESDSVVTATIQTNTDYTVGTDGSGTVSVIDQGATATVPDAIADLSATPGNTQVTLSWTAFDDGGSTITKLEYRQKTSGSYGSWMDISDSPRTLSHTVTGLTNATAYTFQVRAVNSEGDANASNEATATPVADDCAGDSTTTCTVSLGSSVTGNIQAANDVDYFGLSFTSGVTYQIDVEGSPTGRGTLSDPFVTKGFTVGSPAVNDDDGGTGYNARLIWTAEVTGAVYVQVSGNGGLGTYTLTVSVPATDPDPEPGIPDCGRSHWDRNKPPAIQLLEASCEYQARSRNILADGQVSAQELAETTPLVTRLQEIVDEFPCGSGPYRYYDSAGLQKMWKGPAPECLVRTTKSGGGGLPWNSLTPPTTQSKDDWTEDLSAGRRPRGLSAEATVAGNALAWQAPQAAADEVTGYRVLRRAPEEGERTLVPVAEDTGSADTAWTDTDVEEGVRYVYRVKAIRGRELSGVSNYRSVRAAAPAPDERETAALTAAFAEVPAGHEGAGTTFVLRLSFSEAVNSSYRTLRDTAVQADNGAVRKANRVNGSSAEWEITVAPSSDEAVTVTLSPGDGACGEPGAICTADGRKLSGQAVATVARAGTAVSNTAPTGLPAVTGTARVGETLEASVTEIADADGLGNAVFAYQWVSNDGERGRGHRGRDGGELHADRGRGGQGGQGAGRPSPTTAGPERRWSAPRRPRWRRRTPRRRACRRSRGRRGSARHWRPRSRGSPMRTA